MSGKLVQLDTKAFYISNESAEKWKFLNRTIPVVSETLGRRKQPGTMSDSIGAPNRVVIVEPDAHARTRFKEILQSTTDFKLTGDFSSANEALNVVPHSPPNLMLLGFRRNDRRGIECISLFKRLVAGLKIIMVLCAGDTDLLDSGLRYGADNCLIKPINAVQCLATLRVASLDQIVNEPKSQKSELEFNRTTSGMSALLSQREHEVMDGFAQGLLYKEIADKLGLSYSAVHKHQHNIFRKFHVANRSEAIRLWLGMGMNKSSHPDPR